MYCRVLIILSYILLIGCAEESPEIVIGEDNEFHFDFTSDTEGWQGDFADYPKGEEEFYELEFGYSMLPAIIDDNVGAIRESGNNHSDDLFMFIKRKLTGLSANSIYNITFDIQIATNASDNSYGVGGSPATSVYIKAGATTQEPLTEVDTKGYYRTAFDKGNQSVDGEDMILIGDFSNGTDENSYHLKNLTNQNSFTIESDDNGEFWVIIGTDSGFESTTTIYYNSISITLE